MDYVAERATRIDASGIRRIWQMAANMTDPVNFSIGQPDFDAPEALKAAAIKAITENCNGYSVTAGIDPLRQSLAERIGEEFGWPDPRVLISSGLSGALLLSLMGTINPGEEVLIPDPYFVSYRHLVNLLDGKCVFVDTYPDFQLDPAGLSEKITPKTKLLLLNSPANPNGVVYSAEQLKAIAQVARQHELLVLSDEIYAEFSYDGPAASIASFYENTIVLRGFSKTYGVPGWRMGYVAFGPGLAEIFEQMATLQQYTFVCAPHPFQVACADALDCDMSHQIDHYRRKRDRIYNGLKDVFSLTKPGGAFYAFPAAPGGDGEAFVAEAIRNDVLIIPGNVFSQRNSHFRISYATSDEDIDKGIERLRRLAETG